MTPNKQNIHTLQQGGNIKAISTAAENAQRIIDGKLTKNQVDQLLGFRYFSDTSKKEREYIEKLDPEVFESFLQLNDRKIKVNIIHAIEMGWDSFLEYYPEKYTDLLRVGIFVGKTYEKDSWADSDCDPLTVLSRFRVHHYEVKKHSPEEYLEFFNGYARILPSFSGNIDGHTAEEMIKRSLEKGYWKKLFLWLELLGNPPGLGIVGSHEKPEEYFQELDEQEIRFLADISPKKHSSAGMLLQKYIQTKQYFGKEHEITWKRIGASLKNNILAPDIIYSRMKFLTSWMIEFSLTDSGKKKIEEQIREIEFLGGFGRKLDIEKKNFTVCNRLVRLRNTIRKIKEDHDSFFSTHPVYEEELYGVLAKSMNADTETLCETLADLMIMDVFPEVTQIEAIIPMARKLSIKNLQNRMEGCVYEYFSYLLKYRHIDGSLEALEHFLELHHGPSSLSILSMLPYQYEEGWERNPLYISALKNCPAKPLNGNEFGSAFYKHGVNLFVGLGQNGLEISECENLFDKTKKSKDTLRFVSSFLENGNVGIQDVQAFASLIRHRPKNFKKVLQSINPILKDALEEQGLSHYLQFTPWKMLSKRELNSIGSKEGTGSYKNIIYSKCEFLGIDPSKFEKSITSFYRAISVYPNISIHLEKFSQFEKTLFDLEVECVYERVRKYFIRKLELRSIDRNTLEDEKMITLLQILVSNHVNRHVGIRLLESVLSKKERNLFESEENTEWLADNLSAEQRSIWLSRNEEIFQISEKERRNDVSKEREILKFLRVASDLLSDVEFTGEIHINTAEGFIEDLPRFLEENQHLEEGLKKDLKLQSESLSRILTRSESRSVKEVKIYRETDPLRSIMMGDWVDGSCLASYSPIGNSWSTIANATEANKAVLYAEDDKGNVIGRVLLSIDNSGSLVPFTVYGRGIPDVDLEKLFRSYLENLSDRLNMPLNGNPNDVERVMSCKWYVDPVWEMTNEKDSRLSYT